MHGPVADHYAVGGVLDSILKALASLGKDLDALTPHDLAPVDTFHIRGREATVELAARAGLAAGMKVLDSGCGLGGSARYLALDHGCEVTGVDLTPEYVEAATALAGRVGLADRVTFRQGSALDLPFADNGFDAVWTEHVQMNIEDKRAFYRESLRVLKPAGVLMFHDIFRGDAGDPHYPVPWADEPSISFLSTGDDVRRTLDALGAQVLDWEDTSERSLDWFRGVLAQRQESGTPALGIHLLMGEAAPAKLRNVVRNLEEKRIAVVQAVVQARAR